MLCQLHRLPDSEQWNEDVEESDNGLFLRNYIRTSLQQLKKTMKPFRCENQSLSQNMNQGAPEYRERELTTTMWHEWISITIVLNAKW